MKLPGVENAVVDPKKIRDYLTLDVRDVRPVVDTDLISVRSFRRSA